MYQCLEAPQSDIVISVILSESAAKTLDLTCVPIERLAERHNYQYILKPVGSTSPSIMSSSIQNKLIKYFRCNGKRTDAGHIESDVPYLFSTMFRTASQESIVDVEINDDNENSAKYYVNDTSDVPDGSFEGLKVFTRQLLLLKCAAHNWGLKSIGNDLYVSITDSKTSISLTDSVWSNSNVCRICHGGDSVADLLQPCNCKGSIAYVHLNCLERWLRESAYNQCELCNHEYQIIREPKYSIPLSIFLFLRHPGDHLRDLVYDGIAFLIYTPSAVISTYMLMLICESIAKNNVYPSKNVSSHVIAFSAIFGMAAIDFTYSSWLILCLQRHAEAWKIWYRNNCQLKLILPDTSIKRRCSRKNRSQLDISEVD